MYRAPSALLLLALFLGVCPAAAEEAPGLRIVSWNLGAVSSPEEIRRGREQFEHAAGELDPDVLVLQGISSKAVADAVGEVMGLEGYVVACSDFVQDGEARGTEGREVAILSRFAFSQVTEFDPRPDGRTVAADGLEAGGGQAVELALRPVLSLGFRSVESRRGFLRAVIPEIEVSVTVLHLTPSKAPAGRADAADARRREQVAARVALEVREATARLGAGYVHVVAGDFGVAHGDPERNGISLDHDCFVSCGERDRYDETHALLGGGLVEGLRMRNLTGSRSTTTVPDAPGSTVDDIYVSAVRPDRFTEGQAASRRYGTPHLAVFTTLRPSPPIRLTKREVEDLLDAEYPEPAEGGGRPAPSLRTATRAESLLSTLWVQTAAEYEFAARQAYELARLRLDQALERPAWSAELEQSEAEAQARRTAAVILDVDETVLDNAPFQARTILRFVEHPGFGEDFDPTFWRLWVEEEQASLVPGALEFIRYARSREVAVYFVTNRSDESKPHTLANLRAVGIETDGEHLLTKNEAAGRGSSKVSRRKMVAAEHRILLLVGDDLNDFLPVKGIHDPDLRKRMMRQSRPYLGTRWIVLPNPLYGSWRGALGGAEGYLRHLDPM